jgi:hypothetical protein
LLDEAGSRQLNAITPVGVRRRAEHFRRQPDAPQASRKEERTGSIGRVPETWRDEIAASIPSIGPIRAARSI